MPQRSSPRQYQQAGGAVDTCVIGSRIQGSVYTIAFFIAAGRKCRIGDPVRQRWKPHNILSGIIITYHCPPPTCLAFFTCYSMLDIVTDEMNQLFFFYFLFKDLLLRGCTSWRPSPTALSHHRRWIPSTNHRKCRRHHHRR